MKDDNEHLSILGNGGEKGMDISEADGEIYWSWMFVLVETS